jgi:dTDP-4-dehydrorhamnose 3,5-epimerase
MTAGSLQVIATEIPDVKLIEPRVHRDDRGFFMESWNAKAFAAAGLEAGFVQDNHSRSARGVLRGLHYQLTRPQAKLMRVTAGAVFDVAVDLRRSSPTFGRWVGAELSATNRRMLWIPAGFAHGFLALEDGSDLLYKCSDFYVPEDERALAHDDPALAIAWPALDGPRVLSPRDAAAPRLADVDCYA